MLDRTRFPSKHFPANRRALQRAELVDAHARALQVMLARLDPAQAAEFEAELTRQRQRLADKFGKNAGRKALPAREDG